MDRDELQYRVEQALAPEPEDDGWRPPPPGRLTTVHGVDVSYWNQYEFSSISPWSRVVHDPNDPINALMPSITVSSDLFYAGLRLFGDSILAYHGEGDSFRGRSGPFHYYPTILLTCCAAFEAEIRFQSHLLDHLHSGLPPAVRSALLETEPTVDASLQIAERPRKRPPLERYRILLKYGYDFSFNRGTTHWQRGVAAIRTRDKFVHYDIVAAPSITTTQLTEHLEALLLLFIHPSAVLRRTVYAHQFDLYSILVALMELAEDFEEKPILKNTAFFQSSHMFPCTFAHVDDDRYPSAERMTERHRTAR